MSASFIKVSFSCSLSRPIIKNAGGGHRISLPEMNARINELLKQSIKSDGVINLFSDIKQEFSLFDPKFLAEVAKRL